VAETTKRNACIQPGAIRQPGITVDGTHLSARRDQRPRSACRVWITAGLHHHHDYSGPAIQTLRKSPPMKVQLPAGPQLWICHPLWSKLGV